MKKCLSAILALGVCAGLSGCTSVSNLLNSFKINAPSINTNEVVYTYIDVMTGTKVVYDTITLEPTGFETNRVVFPRAVKYECPETVDNAQALFNEYNQTLGKRLAPIDSQESIDFVRVLDSLAGEQARDNAISSSDVEAISSKVYKISNQKIKTDFERATNSSQQQNYRPRQDK